MRLRNTKSLNSVFSTGLPLADAAPFFGFVDDDGASASSGSESSSVSDVFDFDDGGGFFGLILVAFGFGFSAGFAFDRFGSGFFLTFGRSALCCVLELGF